MTSLNASDTRIPPAAFNGVAFKGERICIHRRDGESVYLVSAEDMRLLEALEDRLDAEEARQALARHQATGGETTSLEDMKKRLGR
jgi:PHD/YefM family antitoxin component YafN of YafNO toxin-antitoxin module